MKKSGSFLFWILFFCFANLLFIIISKKTLTIDILPSFFISALFGVAYRILIDWKTFDNVLENELRKLVVSNSMTDGFLFACVGSTILLFSQKFVFSINLGYAFALGIVSIILTQLLFEFARVSYNKYVLVQIQKKMIN